MSRKTSAKNHTHKYFKLENGIWACSMCSHFVPTNAQPPVWRKSICWSCNTEFELNPDNMRVVQPLCNECTRRKLEVLDTDIDVTDWIEMRERAAREKKLQSKLPSIQLDEPESDVVESESTHSPDCEIYAGLECTCGVL